MKTYHVIQRITAMILLAVLCIQPVEFAFAQQDEESIGNVQNQQAEETINQLIDEQADSEPVITKINNTNRFAITEDAYFSDSIVDAYPDGVVCIGLRPKVYNIVKVDGYYRSCNISLTAPEGAVSCLATFIGAQGTNVKYQVTNEQITISDGKVVFTIPFTEDVIMGDKVSGAGVELRFEWRNTSNEVLLTEIAYCEITEDFSWITNLDRVSLSALSNAFEGTNIDKHGQKYGGSVCAIIEAQTGALTEQNGYYYLPGLNIAAPQGAVSCKASFVGEEEGITKYTRKSDAVAVSNGIATINVPFTKDITKSGLGEVFIQLRWKDASGNTVMLEKMHGEFKTSLKLITDKYRFELVNAFYKPGSSEELVPSGVLESSGFSSYSNGLIILDMRVDLEMMTAQDGFYWIHDINLLSPLEEAVSCDISIAGIRETGNSSYDLLVDVDYTRPVHDWGEVSGIGFSIPFNEEAMTGNGAPTHFELIFKWKDENGNYIREELAHCEIGEPGGFDTIDGLPASMYEVIIPDSLKNSVIVDEKDGLVTITVGQATAEQWRDAYLEQEPNATTVLAAIEITYPNGTKCYYDVQGGMEYNSFMKATSSTGGAVWQEGTSSGNGEAIAQVQETANGYTFIPMHNTEGDGKHRYVAWSDASKGSEGNISRAILEQRVVVAEGTDKVTASFDILPKTTYPAANRISYQGDEWFKAPSDNSAYDPQTGTVSFSCIFGDGQNVDSIKNAIKNNKCRGMVDVFVVPPEGYDTVRNSNGREHKIGEGERYEFGHGYWNWNKGEIDLATRSYTESLIWSDSNNTNKPPIRENITIDFNLNGLTWMDIYWKPVPTARIKYTAIEGVEITMVDGGVHTSFKGDKVPDMKALWDFCATITPPTVVKDGKEIEILGLKHNSSGGNASIDYDERMANQQDDIINKSSADGTYNARRMLVNPKELIVDGVSVLFNENLGGEDVTLLDWYDNAACEGEPVYREYIWQTEDDLLYESENDSVEKEEDIKEPVKKPTLVGKKNWKLKLHRFPQANGNDNHAYYFRLEVQQKEGAGGKPEKWIVYLPFDFLGEDVKTLEDAMNKVKGNKKITINHYDDDHKLVEVLEGKITKNGIKFSSKSFSPLVIEVEDIVESLVTGTNGTELKVTQKEDVPEDAGYYGEDAKKALAEKYGTENTMAVVKVKLEKEAEADISGIPGVKTDTLESVVLEISLQYLDASSNEWKKVTKENLNMIPEDGVEVTIPFELFDFTDVEHLGNYEFLVKHLITLPANGSHYNVGDIEDMKVTVMGNGLKITVKNGFSPFVVTYAEKTVNSSVSESSSGSSGISVTYNGGNSFSTSNSAVPTSVEIDGVAVPFTGNGNSFTVGCIDPNAKWVTVKWNSTSVTTNFKPDATVSCINMAIPKTGDVSVLMPVLMLMGALAIQYKKSSK